VEARIAADDSLTVAVAVTVVAYDPSRSRASGRGAARAPARRRRPAAAARRPSHDIDRARRREGDAVTPVELAPNQLHHFYRGGVAPLAGEPPLVPDPVGRAA
jgi:hypothetical protein